LLPNEACNLGSLNLACFALKGKKPNGRAPLDWVEMERVIRLAVRFLDDVIDVNPYPLPEIANMVKANRRIGLGVMGWADLLVQLGIPYDSEQAISLAEEAMAFIRRIGHDESARLAAERGPFPNWSRSIFAAGQPLRNSTVTTIAPTGTISIIAGCSSGIEPLFALAFSHIVGERHLTFVNPHFEALAKERGFYSNELLERVVEHGSVRELPEVPPEAQGILATAHEIGLEWHVRMQAAFQKHTDNGVSKTINLANAATLSDVARAYRLAYDAGCLGITVFRDGCKGSQVLHVGVAKTEPEVPKALVVVEQAGETLKKQTIKPRPRGVNGATYRSRTPMGTAFITVNRNGDDQPFEVFTNVGKAGSDTAAVSEAIGRLISLNLRLPSSLSPTDRVREIVGQLSGIGGPRQLGFGKERVRSLPDAIAQVLAEDLGLTKENNRPIAVTDESRIGDLCPDCGHAALVFEEGCQKCYSCGFSEC
jgi:ribonucleoside-diphosphate reductase alpha chain